MGRKNNTLPHPSQPDRMDNALQPRRNKSSTSKKQLKDQTQLDKEQRVRLLVLQQDLDYLKKPRASSGINFVNMFDGPPELCVGNQPTVENNLDIDFEANNCQELFFSPSSIPIILEKEKISCQA